MKRKIIIEARIEIPVPEDFEVTNALLLGLQENTVVALESETEEDALVVAYAELREVD